MPPRSLARNDYIARKLGVSLVRSTAHEPVSFRLVSNLSFVFRRVACYELC
jgi:hypothetical protein